ncbi:MAG: 3',5'-cyclic-nucleotide phosphodiesterase [Syntrophaceae bacterium]|nr:3',5'-cyclic-nucleotide phosphodiesterase [Syntrophaceae bacterium]
MEIKVLGCSGAEFPGHRPPSFLLDGRILFDTGSLTNQLEIKDQLRIENIFITHSHLDHILGIPFIADNLIFRKKKHRVNILSIPPVVRVIRKSLLDGSIWPDFTVIPNTHEGILSLIELKAGHPIMIDDYTITPYPVNHSVPATGYLVEDKSGKRFFYTGDMGPSDQTWKKMEGQPIHCLLIEVSFPNRMKDVALKTGHLTPRLVSNELSKINPYPKRVFIIHIKPQYSKTIQSELQKLNLTNLRLLKDGETIKI